MVKLPGGTYMIGSPENEKSRDSSETPHNVTLLPFSIGIYEITQKQYKEVAGTNPSRFKGDNLPAENLKWFDAINFCNKLSIKHGLKPYYKMDEALKTSNNPTHLLGKLNYKITVPGGNGFRLPTEAEWEFACRGGTSTAFHFGDKLDSSMANFNGNSPYDAIKGINREQTTEAGNFTPNAFGLYIMHGNVSEWCYDCFRDYTTTGDDPAISTDCTNRVKRGGSWINNGEELRSAARSGKEASDGYSNVGFRVARSSSK